MARLDGNGLRADDPGAMLASSIIGVCGRNVRCMDERSIRAFGPVLGFFAIMAARSAAQCPGYLSDAITAPDPTGAPKQFGHAVAIDGDTLVVGAPSNAGAAYVFERLAGQWTFQAKLMATDADAWDAFGRSVAIGANASRIAVGAIGDDAVGLDEGAAYVFDRLPTGGWVQVAKLTPVSPTTTGFSTSFGSAVAVAGSSVLVGSPVESYVGSASGAIYSYERDAGTWTFKQKYWPADVQADAFFGGDIEVEGDKVFSMTLGLSGSPGVYEYSRVGTQWVQSDKVTPSQVAGSAFGPGLQVAGNTIAVGAYGDPGTSGTMDGAAFVFEKLGGAWQQTAKLYSPNCPLWLCFFGDGLALGADTLVVCQPNLPQASIHVYRRNASGAWTWHSGGPLSNFAPGYKLPNYTRGTPRIDGGTLLMSVTSSSSPADEQVQVVELNEGDELFGCTGNASIANPKPVLLDLTAGATSGGQLYLVLGSTSGTSPGVAVGAGLTLPLNVDAYTLFTLENPNSPVMSGSLGILDGQGNGVCTLSLPSGLGPGLAGITVDHAFIVLDIVGGTGAVQVASNAFAVQLTP